MFSRVSCKWRAGQPESTLSRQPRSNRTTWTLFATAPATYVAMVTCHSHTRWRVLPQNLIIRHFQAPPPHGRRPPRLLPPPARPLPWWQEKRVGWWRVSNNNNNTFPTSSRAAALCTIPGGAVCRHVFWRPVSERLIGRGILWRWLVRAVPIRRVVVTRGHVWRGLWLGIGLLLFLFLLLFLQHVLHLVGQLWATFKLQKVAKKKLKKTQNILWCKQSACAF